MNIGDSCLLAVNFMKTSQVEVPWSPSVFTKVGWQANKPCEATSMALSVGVPLLIPKTRF